MICHGSGLGEICRDGCPDCGHAPKRVPKRMGVYACCRWFFPCWVDEDLDFQHTGWMGPLWS